LFTKQHVNKLLLSDCNDFRNEYKTRMYTTFKLTVEIHM